MQRIEGTIGDMGQTMESVLTLLKHVDEKLDRISTTNNTRSTKSVVSQMNVKFSSAPEEIP
jgi:hypothetical protein